MSVRDGWIADRRSDDELFAAALAELHLDEEEYDAATDAFAVLLWRSGPAVLERAIRLTESSAWEERELGVDLLGRIHDPSFRDVDEREAWSTSAIRNGYLDETMPVLLALAGSEEHPEVIEALAWTFGQREDPRGIAPLTRFATSPVADIREAATKSLPMCGLRAHDPETVTPADGRAIAELIATALVDLADDPVGDIRDWALFGLSLSEVDTPEIRDTFFAHIDDPHHDAMTEAIYGLANLGDPRGIEPLRQRIEGGDDPRILIEACELYGDARLVPGLQALRDDDHDGDEAELDAALTTCRAGAGWRGPSLDRWQTRVPWPHTLARPSQDVRP